MLCAVRRAPTCSFDLAKDDLGAPRSTFPHTMFMVAGTQASSSRQNYVAFCKLAALGQGRHGKKESKKKGSGSDSDSDDESDSDDSMSSSGGSDKSGGGDDKDKEGGDKDKEPPPRLHYRCGNTVAGRLPGGDPGGGGDER